MLRAGEIVNSSGGYQLIEHPRVGVHTIGRDLIGVRSMFQDVGEESSGGGRGSPLGDSAVDDQIGR